MDYLNNTLVFLQEENRELKQQLRRISDLNNLITSQRNEEQKQCLARMHQQEINVIREIAADTQKMLRREIKKANQEIKEMAASLQKQYDAVNQLKKEVRKLTIDKQRLLQDNHANLEKLILCEAKLKYIDQDYLKRFQRVEGEYKARQEEIIEKYMSRLEELKDKHQQGVFQKQNSFQILQKKLELTFEEKQILQEELTKLTFTFRHEEQKKVTKIKMFQNQIEKLKKVNQQIQQNLYNQAIKNYEALQKLKKEERKKAKLEQQIENLKKLCQKLQYAKIKDVQKQKSRTISVCKNLQQHQKYLKNQVEVSKKKNKEYNQSTKMLLNKIREIQGKSQQNKSGNTSFYQKTTIKSSKKQFQTYQSISLDNSFNKDSPSVSCFLKSEKIDEKFQIKKKCLKIDTQNHDTLLRFKDLETPCFQSAKQKNVKKTIKIRK